MADISQFKNHMKSGGARPNQFRVDVTWPNIAPDNNAQTALSFLCKSASLPASIVEDITTMYRGRPVHFAGERAFQPWAISVYNDNDFLVRDALEKWHNAIINYDATRGELSPANYQVNVQVHQLTRNGGISKTYKLVDAYPTSIGPIQLDYEQNNQIEIFDVEFTYNYFEPITGDAVFAVENHPG